MPRQIFVYDCYVRIEAETKDDADWLLRDVEQAVDRVAGASLQTFDAFGIEDAETGEEIRPVG